MNIVMSFCKLPIELHNIVGASLDESKDILSVARTSQRLCPIYLRLLDDLNIDVQHSSAILWAIKHSSPKLIQRLLLHPRVEVNLPDENNQTPIFYAIRDGNTRSLHALIKDHRVNVNWYDRTQTSPISLAAALGFANKT